MSSSLKNQEKLMRVKPILNIS